MIYNLTYMQSDKKKKPTILVEIQLRYTSTTILILIRNNNLKLCKIVGVIMLLWIGSCYMLPSFINVLSSVENM